MNIRTISFRRIVARKILSLLLLLILLPLLLSSCTYFSSYRRLINMRNNSEIFLPCANNFAGCDFIVFVTQWNTNYINFRLCSRISDVIITFSSECLTHTTNFFFKYSWTFLTHSTLIAAFHLCHIIIASEMNCKKRAHAVTWFNICAYDVSLRELNFINFRLLQVTTFHHFPYFFFSLRVEKFIKINMKYSSASWRI